MNSSLSILLTLMVLWIQALPGVRCLHTGNVLPISVLLTTAEHCCCHKDCDDSPKISSQARQTSCYVDAPSDASSIWSKVKIANLQTVLAIVVLRLCEKSSQTLRPVVTAESRAPPWMARRAQLSYLTYRSLLI